MDTPATLRLRFAPSPTGYLHTGGARTALFNYLWAEQAKRRVGAAGSRPPQVGQPPAAPAGNDIAFILRVEDTDEQRSTEESTRAILDGLAWLGIAWDEGPDPDPAHFGESLGPHGPYFQSMRRDLHQQRIDELLAAGHAFYCPATDAEMTGPDGRKLLFSPYREASPEEQQAALERARADGHAGLPVRLKCPHGVKLAWDDVIRGAISFDSDELGDFIIRRSNGSVLYNFAVTCDDYDMRVSHVLRGEDHISNTPKQLLLYRALGWEPPVFGHVPLILGMDRARLSKRHGATRVEAYQDLGVLPEALVNFLALIGWAPKDNRELFSMDELVEAFNPHDIGTSSGAFNIDKLEHFNGQYLRALTPKQFAQRALPYLPERWVAEYGADYCARVLALYQDKLTMLAQAHDNCWYFFQDPQDRQGEETDEGAVGAGWYNDDTVAKFVTNNADAPRVLAELYAAFDSLPAAEWTVERLEHLVESFCAASGLGKGKAMQPWRVILTGDKISPGFYDLLAVLGKETVMRRTRPWVEKLAAARA
jgi:glutamyl-tRNA synthetase